MADPLGKKRRVYAIVPAALMLVFVVGYRSAPDPAALGFRGESLFGWNQPPVVEVAIRSSVTASSGDEYEGRDGLLEAQADLRAGKVILLGYGLPYPWHAELKEVWARDFDVESRDVAGCFVADTLVAYVADYNRVMYAHLVSRFGSNVFEVVARRARALHAERYLQKG